jgi:hypothetical protein
MGGSFGKAAAPVSCILANAFFKIEPSTRHGIAAAFLTVRRTQSRVVHCTNNAAMHKARKSVMFLAVRQ